MEEQAAPDLAKLPWGREREDDVSLDDMGDYLIFKLHILY